MARNDSIIRSGANGPTTSIHTVETPKQWTAVKQLFTAYANSLPFDLDFQGFEAELRELPGCYAEPRGTVLLASLLQNDKSEFVGCIALRPLEGAICEMKRLFVTPLARGLGIARLLVARFEAAARDRNYRKVRLDTVASLETANRLYKTLGYVACEQYCHNPLPDALFFEKELVPDG